MISKIVTQRKSLPADEMLQGLTLGQQALLSDEFHLVNMSPYGIWLVDEQHPKYQDILQTAIANAKAHHSKEQTEEYQQLLEIHLRQSSNHHITESSNQPA